MGHAALPLPPSERRQPVGDGLWPVPNLKKQGPERPASIAPAGINGGGAAGFTPPPPSWGRGSAGASYTDVSYYEGRRRGGSRCGRRWGPTQTGKNRDQRDRHPSPPPGSMVEGRRGSPRRPFRGVGGRPMPAIPM